MEKTEKWISSDNFLEHRIAIALYVVNSRLSNYGYDYKDFKAMSNKLSKLRNELRNWKAFSEQYYGIYSRFYFIGTELHYCIGQSQNEEMITVAECLTNKIK